MPAASEARLSFLIAGGIDESPKMRAKDAFLHILCSIAVFLLAGCKPRRSFPHHPLSHKLSAGPP